MSFASPKARVLLLLQSLAIAVLLVLYVRELSRPEPVPEAGKIVDTNTDAETAPREGLELDERPGPGRNESPSRVARKSPGSGSSRAPSGMSPVLLGRCLDEAGLGVAGVYLTLSSAHSRGELSTQSAKDGAFAIAGLTAGRWMLRTRKSHFVPVFEEFDIDAKSSPRYLELRVVRAQRIEVEVCGADGTGAQELLHRAAGVRNLPLQVFATRNADPAAIPVASWLGFHGLGLASMISRDQSGPGIDELQKRPDSVYGFLYLHAPPPLWLHLSLRGEVLQSQALPPGADRARFVLPEGSLRSTLCTLRLRVVRAEDREPLSGASLRLRGGGMQFAQVKTPEDGKVAFETLVPGPATLVIQADGREVFRQNLLLRPNAPVDLGDLALSPALVLRTRILDADGAPTRASLSLVPAGDSGALFPTRKLMSFVSGEDGYVQTGNLGRRRYRYYASSDSGQEAHGHLDLSAGPPQGVEIRLQRTHHVTLVHGYPPNARGYYRIEDGSGAPLAFGPFGRRPHFSARLPDGRYQVVLHDGRRELRRQELRVQGKDEVVRLEQD